MYEYQKELRTCLTCNTKFNSKSINQLFCCRKCRTKYYNEIHSTKHKEKHRCLNCGRKTTRMDKICSKECEMAIAYRRGVEKPYAIDEVITNEYRS